MSETFRQYIRIRTFLGYRPKEILRELQHAFGDEAPTYANVQRWSKRFRDAVDSPLGSPLDSQLKFHMPGNQSSDNDKINNDNDNKQIQEQINTNARQSEPSRTSRSKQLLTNRSRSKRVINE